MVLDATTPGIGFSSDLPLQHATQLTSGLPEANPGVTVITHGFALDGNGDSLMPLAEAIGQRTDGCIMDYDISSEGGQGEFDQSCVATLGQKEVIVLWDWGVESNESSDGWGEAAADALFATLVIEGLLDPAGRFQQRAFPLYRS